MLNGHFWIRICILILTLLLILLSISYAFGAMSTTKLLLVDKCPRYELEEIWNHSLLINNSAPVYNENDCYQKTAYKPIYLPFDVSTYQYEPVADEDDKYRFLVFQCIVFVLFTVYGVCIFLYGLYSLIKDRIAVKKRKLYQSAPKFENYVKNNNNLNQNGVIQQQKPQHPINACIERWKRKFDEHFGTDTDLHIARTLLFEILEIILQTFALLLYNGYDVWNPEKVFLAHLPQFIYLFVSVLSFNCMITGILWLLYTLRNDKFGGLLFHLSLFCVDQFSDLFYAYFSLIVVLWSANILEIIELDSGSNNQIWVLFGLLHNENVSAFIYTIFPMFILYTKCLIMTRKAIRSMRNRSFDLWLLVTKIMDTTNDKDATFLAHRFGFKLIKNISNTTSNNLSIKQTSAKSNDTNIAGENNTKTIH